MADAQGADLVKRNRAGQGRFVEASVAIAAVLSLVPTAGWAVGAFEPTATAPQVRRAAMLTPASVDPQLARFIAERQGEMGRLKRFTPAGVDTRPGRTLTVAVRVDAEEARALSLRSAVDAVQDTLAGGSPGIRLASTRYNLGLSRGYQNFAQVTPKTSELSPTLSEAGIPNLSDFRPSRGAAQDESRFAARIAGDRADGVADVEPGAVAAQQTLDVAGSYRLTRNLDVTAGVRYSQEHDRLAPLRRGADADNQAVYIGTQFRF